MPNFAVVCCVTPGAAGSHGRRDVSDGVVGVPHRGQRLAGSNLHHLGPQQAVLRHAAAGPPGARLGPVHQRADGGSERGDVTQSSLLVNRRSVRSVQSVGR